MQFDIIIPAAGRGQRIGSSVPKGMISLGNETVIQRQVRLLKVAYPESRILVVGGHKHDKLHKSLPADVGMVLNQEYQNSNVSQSIKIGLEHTKADRAAMILYGDLVFNEQTLPKEWPAESAIIVDESEMRPDEVGVSEANGYAITFAFGLPTKWSHIVMLTPKDKELFIAGCKPAHRFRYFGYEILNSVIEGGGRFKLMRPDGMKLVEIDTIKDISKAVELACH